MQTIVETYYMRIWLYKICSIGALRPVNISLSQTLMHETHIVSQICLSIPQKFNFTSDKHWCDFSYVCWNKSKTQCT